MSETNHQSIIIHSPLNTILRYLRLFWRWKWYTGTLLPLLTTGWFVYIYFINQRSPDLTATMLLGVENPKNNMLIMPEIIPELGKVELLKSRSFLGDVVDRLSLRLSVSGHQRNDIFEKFIVDKAMPSGSYSFKIKNNMHGKTYEITYKEKLFSKKQSISTGALGINDSIKINGSAFWFNKPFREEPFNFNFQINRKQVAVEQLRKNLNVISNMKRDPLREGVVPVELTGKDPELIASTLNAIGNLFIERNIQFRKSKTEEIMGRLQEQLQTAEQQLQNSQLLLSQFKRNNPIIGLPEDVKTSVERLDSIEMQISHITNIINQSKDIYGRLVMSSKIDNINNISEALIFLQENQIPAAEALQTDINQISQREYFLNSNNYPKNHYLSKNHNENIHRIFLKTLSIMENYINDQEKNYSRIKSIRNKLKYRIRQISSQQNRLSELKQKHEISIEIYSTIMARYNQAKITDATENSNDIYIMDYAVPPPRLSNLKSKYKILVAGLFFCLLISLAPPVIVDTFFRRAYVADDLKTLVPFSVLGSVPQISHNKIKKITDHNLPYISNRNKFARLPENDILLISDISSQTYFNLFRFISTRIDHPSDTSSKSILFTSINTGEGKSFVSSNIAIAYAQQKKRTLIIDCDFWRGVQHDSFSLPKSPGLTELLNSNCKYERQLIDDFIQKTDTPDLFLLSSGNQVNNPYNLLNTKFFPKIYTTLLEQFDIVIIDTPPLTTVIDAIVLSKFVQDIILVVKAKESNISELLNILHDYPFMTKKIKGLLLNCSTTANEIKKYHYTA